MVLCITTYFRAQNSENIRVLGMHAVNFTHSKSSIIISLYNSSREDNIFTHSDSFIIILLKPYNHSRKENAIMQIRGLDRRSARKQVRQLCPCMGCTAFLFIHKFELSQLLKAYKTVWVTRWAL